MTFCEECRRAELTPWQRIREDLWDAVHGGSSALRFVRAYGATLSAAMGRTAYDRHRDEYVRTGDERELRRMLRHVAQG